VVSFLGDGAFVGRRASMGMLKYVFLCMSRPTHPTVMSASSCGTFGTALPLWVDGHVCLCRLALVRSMSAAFIWASPREPARLLC